MNRKAFLTALSAALLFGMLQRKKRGRHSYPSGAKTGSMVFIFNDDGTKELKDYAEVRHWDLIQFPRRKDGTIFIERKDSIFCSHLVKQPETEESVFKRIMELRELLKKEGLS